MGVEQLSLKSVIPEKSLVSIASVEKAHAEEQQITQLLDEKLTAHRKDKFTGVVYVCVQKDVHWKLYFRSGWLKWALAKNNQKRSWHRQLSLHYPALLERISTEDEIDYSGENFPHQKIAYAVLIKQIQERKVDGTPLAKTVEAYLGEILFDIIQEGVLRQQYGEPLLSLVDKTKEISSARLLSVRIGRVWQKTQVNWQDWQDAGLTNCSPTLKPVISKVKQLKDYIPEEVYRCVSDLVRDNRCLRDMAVELDQPLLAFTKRIHPFIKEGMIGLVTVQDFGSKTDKPDTHSLAKAKARSKAESAKLRNSSDLAGSKTSSNTVVSSAKAKAKLKRKKQSQESNQTLIVHVEDSQADSRKMATIVQTACCQYFNIQESIHAIPLLIEKKPQLIFLDLVMPIANGYEICTQIRRVSTLKHVPIIIVTSNNGISDRLRSKVTGASGFLSKPIESEKVLEIINRFLPDKTNSVGIKQHSQQYSRWRQWSELLFKNVSF